MRLIGEIPKNLDQRVLEDHLLAQGIKTRFDRRPDGWSVWIVNEDHVEAARKELQEYLAAPDDPRFRANASRAKASRKHEAKKEREFRKNYRYASNIWAAPTFLRRPVTIATVVIAVAVYFMQNLSYGLETVEWLSYFDWRGGPPILREYKGLTDILHGQIWRAVSPIFLHFSLPHIFFNCYWVLILGTAIELNRGRWKLLAIILGSAVLSNYAQYAYVEHFNDSMLGPGKFYTFGGLSGVNFALFGYIWMMGENHPEEGLRIDSRNTVLMLGWLVLCFTGLVGPIANAAHLSGLAVGMILGLMRF